MKRGAKEESPSVCTSVEGGCAGGTYRRRRKESAQIFTIVLGFRF
ncbi:hypothetical protein [uncultured Rikenella sp.]|nr:hypothetical protein [uncultured Rikenella sp.]